LSVSQDAIIYHRRGDIVVYNYEKKNGELVYRGSGEARISDSDLLEILKEHGVVFLSGLQGTGKTYLAYYLASSLAKEYSDKNAVALILRYNPGVEGIVVREARLRVDGLEYDKPVVVVESNLTGENLWVLYTTVLSTIMYNKLPSEVKEKISRALSRLIRREAKTKDLGEQVVSRIESLFREMIFYSESRRTLAGIFRDVGVNLVSSIQYSPVVFGLFSILTLAERTVDKNVKDSVNQLPANTVS